MLLNSAQTSAQGLLRALQMFAELNKLQSNIPAPQPAGRRSLSRNAWCSLVGVVAPLCALCHQKRGVETEPVV